MVLSMVPLSALAQEQGAEQIQIPENVPTAEGEGSWSEFEDASGLTLDYWLPISGEALDTIRKNFDGLTVFVPDSDGQYLVEAENVTATFWPAKTYENLPPQPDKLEMTFKGLVKEETVYYIALKIYSQDENNDDVFETAYVKVVVPKTSVNLGNSHYITMDRSQVILGAESLPVATCESKHIILKTTWTRDGKEVDCVEEGGTYIAAITVTTDEGYELPEGTTFNFGGPFESYEVKEGVITVEVEVAPPTDIKTAQICVSGSDLLLLDYEGEDLSNFIRVSHKDPNEYDYIDGKYYEISITQDGQPAELIKAGKYIVKATGKLSYTGEITAEITIQKFELDLSKETWDTKPNIVYDSEIHKPTLSYDGGRWVDITYSYTKDGTQVDSPKDVGTYTATAAVSLKDEYDSDSVNLTGLTDGKLTFNYTIEPATITSLLIAPQDANVTKIEAGTVLKATNLPADAEGTYQWTINGEVKEGAAEATYTVADGDASIALTFIPEENGNYVSSPVTSNTVNVGSTVIAEGGVSLAEGQFTYSGKAQEPNVTVTVGEAV